jgi:hypothetical protein
MIGLMATAHEPLGMYLHLARASQQRRRPMVRDKMLVLAGAVAAERGLAQVAACCRERVLGHNAGHLIGQYPTFAAALEDERFQTFLRKLRRDFSLEKAEHILSSLGIELAGERETYYTDHEYAASLLGLTTEELDRRFGDGKAMQSQRIAPADAPMADVSGAPAERSSIICRSPGNWHEPARIVVVVVMIVMIILLVIAAWLLR